MIQKRKININRMLLLILILIIFITIFRFSSENSTKSEDTSGKVVNAVIEINPKSKKLNELEKKRLGEKMVKPIRKLAHFTIYMMLGIAVMNYMNTYKMYNKRRIILTIIVGMLYATSDEIHQFFVPGRSAEVRDVCIDTLGVICGVIIATVVKNTIFDKISSENFEKIEDMSSK